MQRRFRHFILIALGFSQISLIGIAQTPSEPSSDPFVIVKNGRYGFIDQTGSIVLPPIYYWSEGFVHGLSRTYICGRLVKIDRSGGVVPLVRAADGGLKPFGANGKIGFLDSRGNFEIPPSFDDALPFSEHLAAVKTGDKWGFVDESGTTIFPPQFDAAFYFMDGVANVDIRGASYIIDRQGKVIYRGTYLSTPAQGLIPITSSDDAAKGGFIDHGGNIVMPFTYDDVSGFSEGLAAVRKGEKYGYINTNGETIIPFEFDSADQFAGGLAPVKMGPESGFIDKSGSFVFHLKFFHSALRAKCPIIILFSASINGMKKPAAEGFQIT